MLGVFTDWMSAWKEGGTQKRGKQRRAPTGWLISLLHNLPNNAFLFLSANQVCEIQTAGMLVIQIL